MLLLLLLLGLVDCWFRCYLQSINLITYVFCPWSFSQVPLTGEDWMTVLAWSSPILLVDEVLKFVGRRLQAKAKQAKAEGKQP